MTADNNSATMEVHSFVSSMDSEVKSQLQELRIPDNHLRLIEHIVLLSLEKARQHFNEKKINAGAFSDPDKGIIYLVLDLRASMAHEIGHLVWRNILTSKQRENYSKLCQSAKDEWLKRFDKLLRKYSLTPVTPLDHVPESYEEDFCWAYAIYLIKDDGLYHQTPQTNKWLKENVFREQLRDTV